MPDREKVIGGLRQMLIHYNEMIKLDGDTKNHVLLYHKAMVEDALTLLKEQRIKGQYVPCKVGKWNGEKCSVCGTEYIGSAPLQWKFCPDCGTKMEGR